MSILLILWDRGIGPFDAPLAFIDSGLAPVPCYQVRMTISARCQSLVKGMMLVLILALIPGCAAIGVELIGPGNSARGDARIHDASLHWESNRLTSIVSLEVQHLPGRRSPSTNELVQILGSPSEHGSNFIRYRTAERIWWGLAVDLAIFPIPLTLPLMLPGEKTGYVDFVSDGNGVKVVERRTRSRFYGFGAGDKEVGFYWGTQSGGWFNPD